MEGAGVKDSIAVYESRHRRVRGDHVAGTHRCTDVRRLPIGQTVRATFSLAGGGIPSASGVRQPETVLPVRLIFRRRTAPLSAIAELLRISSPNSFSLLR